MLTGLPSPWEWHEPSFQGPEIEIEGIGTMDVSFSVKRLWGMSGLE